jgi:hypothetical protein
MMECLCLPEAVARPESSRRILTRGRKTWGSLTQALWSRCQQEST